MNNDVLITIQQAKDLLSKAEQYYLQGNMVKFESELETVQFKITTLG